MISGTRWCGVFAPSSRMRRRPVAGGAARPLHYQRHGMGLVEQPKPALVIAGTRVSGVEKHPATDQDAQGLRHQRTDPPHVEIGAAIASAPGEAFVDVDANWTVPVPAIGCIDGEFRHIGRNPDIVFDQHELAPALIEKEDIDGVVVCEDQAGLRPVDNETGGALRGAGLEEGRKDVVSPRTNRKDGADGNVVLEVGRAVERIDRYAERRLGIECFGQRYLLGQHRGNRGPLQRRSHDVVGRDVDVLLLVTVGIDAIDASGDSRQRPVGDERRKFDPRRRDRLDHLAHRSTMRRLRREPIEMRMQGQALMHGRLPAPTIRTLPLARFTFWPIAT